jgi:hypothetical protein
VAGLDGMPNATVRLDRVDFSKEVMRFSVILDAVLMNCYSNLPIFLTTSAMRLASA